MSIMIEVLYHSPPIPRGKPGSQQHSKHLRALDVQEEPGTDSLAQTICLTYEFDERHSAEAGAKQLRNLGEHAEGPMDYGTTNR